MRRHYLDHPHLSAKRAVLIRAIDEGKPLSTVSLLYIQYVLASFGGNKVHASEALKIERRTIQRHIKRGLLCDEKTSSLSSSVPSADVTITPAPIHLPLSFNGSTETATSVAVGS
jgi:hypothetical protein